MIARSDTDSSWQCVLTRSLRSTSTPTDPLTPPSFELQLSKLHWLLAVTDKNVLCPKKNNIEELLKIGTSHQSVGRMNNEAHISVARLQKSEVLNGESNRCGYTIQTYTKKHFNETCNRVVSLLLRKVWQNSWSGLVPPCSIYWFKWTHNQRLPEYLCRCSFVYSLNVGFPSFFWERP